MAGFIKISDSQAWSSSNWVYWGLMDHLIDVFSNDPATANLVEQCKWAQSMSFPILREDSPDMVGRIREDLETVAERIVLGELQCAVDGRELEQSSQLQFRGEIKRLTDMMRENQSRPA